jgi:hypothetical protein
MKISTGSTALGLFSVFSSTVRTTTTVGAFHIALVPSIHHQSRTLPTTSTVTRASKSTSTSLRYRDGPEVDLYEHVTAEVMRPDVAVPPAAKQAYVVNEEEELQQQQQKACSTSKTTTTTLEPPSVWETSKVQIIEGGCLKTFTLNVVEVAHVQLLFRNNGTPLNAKADVFCGPGNAPMQLAVYSDNGASHPFSGVICTPYMVSHSIGIKNTGPIDENPMAAVVLADMEHIYTPRHNGHNSSNNNNNRSSTTAANPGNLAKLAQSLLQFGTIRRIQGGDHQDFAFHKPVESVQILLKTDGRPCQARVELCSDNDNTIAQVVEVYSEDGQSRPFFAVLETPGLSTMVRVVNVGDPSFPISACVEPFMVDADCYGTSATGSPEERMVQEIGLDDCFHHSHSVGRQSTDHPLHPGGEIGIPGIEDDVGFFFVD